MAHGNGPTVGETAPDRDDELARVLARAFFDDPVMDWLFPDEERRMKAMVPFYRFEVTETRRKGLVLAPTDPGAAALWLPPDAWRSSPLEIVRALPMGLRSFGPRLIPRAVATLDALESVHPSEPHWYLSIIGTDPERQGEGFGAALIRSVTDRCDRELIPAYLESSKEANVPYYERFGFRVTGEVHVPRGGPTLWKMWRDPDPESRSGPGD